MSAEVRAIKDLGIRIEQARQKLKRLALQNRP
jgi:hypothetical protein